MSGQALKPNSSSILGARADFPLLVADTVVYLDSAASTQKPKVVLDALQDFYTHSYANVHRGVYRLGEKATQAYEDARVRVARFINAPTESIIFTRGTTESVNLVAQSWGRANLKSGEEIITTVLEHHSNFVPWQCLAEETGARVHYIGLTESGELSQQELLKAINKNTKIVAVTCLANGLGVAPDIRTIIKAAHEVGAVVLLDAAQAVSRMPLDVTELGADFVVFSGHKIYGPTGIGVLYGAPKLLQAMPPYQTGGEMIEHVSIAGTTFNVIPYKFEAGTPNIAGAVGLGAAIDYVNKLGVERIAAHEAKLVRALEELLSDLPGIQMLGPVGKHVGLVCFTAQGVHPHDLAQFLDKEGIAVRAGHHCAQPLLEALGVQASTRASFGVYNELADVEKLGVALEKARAFFGN